MKEIDTKTLKSFTTEPKIRRFLKRGAFISVNRAVEFMAHLWEAGLKKCGYETLEWEFIQYFGSNDKRTVERYLGRPEKIERHMGLSKVVRMNRQSGKVAQFEYMNERKLPAKKGLLEILGFINRVKEGNEWRYIIHHERMPYYTVQTTLTEPETEAQETANILQEFEGSSEESKEDLRVCSLYIEPHSLIATEGVRGKRFGENPMFCEANRGESVSPMGLSPTNMRGDMGGEKKKEEEVIDSTHTNQLSESELKGKTFKDNEESLNISKHKEYASICLTPEEEAILNAKPLDSEPDRAKIKWEGDNRG